MNENLTVYDWDDEIEKESSFTLLEPGDYNFTISHFDKGWYDGSDKLPPCNQAIVFFNVYDDKGNKAQLRVNYQLCAVMEWKLSELFKAIGLKKEGQRVRMQWDKVPGATGRCKVIQVPGTKDPSKMFNQIDSLYAKTAKAFTPGAF